ncbi:probable serine/threonine-protein kinase At1g54610 [Amborella trichopoda]|uniref:Protein kinase domain-containing protein n=1 Tax=Amborella trichopoda TaxID=13333 RepID=W1PHD0_AMBTC|nr:probable serine/threonine-protein kinase At1g54610 [Amborella trichopoda]ERN06520.1 hypothetical protein AMTR_s00058p00088010 [Amborella trichopoda]|eukprot:XP_006844845.1 probable serine/threonine-protein kinase At1g54610 [Amborella trichopoda]
MGCIASKQAVSVTPALDYSGGFRNQNSGIHVISLRSRAGFAGSDSGKKDESSDRSHDFAVANYNGEESGRSNSNSDSVSFRLGNLHKYVEGEQVAAGWPAWLSAVAGEAIHGWVPLKVDSFEKLEKIGQGTYSSVFRARDLETGRIVALKKVRFDNFEPESVRFMAREILILRRLDHPNVIKLEGLITSRMSCSMYLVFEYMDHDLAGLSSCPDIIFSESQVKCYMKQLLSGLEHCHSRGVMHRDIKGSNLLVNNEGILKIADFGLANFVNPSHKQPLTSRVVTLWYRPPELLLGSTDYGASVDLWSVGCVFAELLLGKPILQGRTEVEQLHKIFKLCGSPPDEYWKKSKLPHATIFKPQHPYESSLAETLKGIPSTASDLIGNLLSIETYKRGSASVALSSEYFTTKPYACDPSSLPKYPPNKEIDAKGREEEARRKKTACRARGSEVSRRASRISKVSREAKNNVKKALPAQSGEVVRKSSSTKINVPWEEGFNQNQQKPTVKPHEEDTDSKSSSQGESVFSGPLPVAASTGFAWARKRKEDRRSHGRSGSRNHVSSGSSDLSNALKARHDFELSGQANGIPVNGKCADSIGGNEQMDLVKRAMLKQWTQFERPDSFDASDYHSQELSAAIYQKEEFASRRHNMGCYQDHGDRVEFSGPLLSQASKVEELLEKHERHIRQAVRKSWFQRGRKQGK